jgi:hypothetical protein
VWGFVASGCAVLAQSLAIAAGSAVGLFLGFLFLGLVGSATDVAINVSGAALEQSMSKTVMPMLHAGWSVGTFAGVGIGAIATTVHFPLVAQLVILAIATTAIGVIATRTLHSASSSTRPQPADTSAPTPVWKSPLVLALGGAPDLVLRRRFVPRPVLGGFLLQTADFPAEAPRQDVATQRAPSDAERRVMAFAWTVCKHVKSNAIVLASGTGDGACFTVGVGAGQMSRVDAAKIAVEKAGERAKGCIVASDAFFPFADGLQVCAKAGAVAVVQPGGSKRDEEVIAAANEHAMAMVMTGQRHFRH